MGWKTLSTVDIHGNDEQITQKKEAVNMLFANLNNLHVHLFNREKIAEFLERYPLVQGILLQVASHLSGAFPENSQLTLSWHNVDSLYEALCLNLRLKDYPPSVVDELMDLQKMIDEYDLINDNPGLFTVSSDFVII